MYVPKHRATHAPARRRASTLSMAAFGAVAVGITTLGGSPASAAPVAAVAPVAAAAPAAALGPVSLAVSSGAVGATFLPSHTVAPPRVRAAASTSAVAARAVRAAASRQGTPYRWGAAGPSAFDCSGLVMWSYAQAGKRLPRTTTTQYLASTKIAQSAKRPGDLIFYYSGGSIYHVGIYAGNNKVWVARHSGTRITLQTIYTNSYYVGRVA